MKITKLYTGEDNKSYFEELAINIDHSHPLGHYSEKYPATGIKFREFKEDAHYDWHNAPQPQYIIYLEGKVEVETSGGEKRTFGPGDILFATDLSGKGHITRTLSKGTSIVVIA